MMKNNIRNFVIIAHIDHGKSTLADRFLEITNTIEKNKMREQFLDRMDLERERGITIKMQPIRMHWQMSKHSKFILNLIDTPGHSDFTYEVSRALAAVEGAILLVDATKGIQSQTLSNLELAKKQNLFIIPVVNKIDLKHSEVKKTKEEIRHLLKIEEKKIFSISAKNGENTTELLKGVVEKIPCPTGDIKKPFKALVFDSLYDPFKGIIVYLKIIDGIISINEDILFLRTKEKARVKEIGYFKPDLVPCKSLFAGEIGYLATGIKESRIRIGDTIVGISFKKMKPLAGYQEPKPVVFVSFYPEQGNAFELLSSSLSKIRLTDPSFIFKPISREVFDKGFLCGFLGMLHMEIILERLKREYNLDIIISKPSVVYKIIDKKNNENLISSAIDFPKLSEIKEIQEPFLELRIITPSNFLGNICQLLENFSARYINTECFQQVKNGIDDQTQEDKIILIYKVAMREIINNFYDKLKSVSKGYASMNYKIIGFEKSDLIKLSVLINRERYEIFSEIVSKHKAYQQAREIALKLKENLPRQQFSQTIQITIEGKIIARETVKTFRKDVTAPLYGGDVTRKKKLLEKQKKGKKKLSQITKIKLPKRLFLKMLSLK